MKAVVAAFNQEKALVGAFSVITNLRMELFEALVSSPPSTSFNIYSVSVLGGEDDLVTVYSFHERRVVVRGQGHKSWVSVVSTARL